MGGTRRVGSAIASVVALAALAACSSGNDSTSTPRATSITTVSASTPPPTTGSTTTRATTAASPSTAPTPATNPTNTPTTTKTGVSIQGDPPTPVPTVTSSSIEQCGDVGGDRVAWTASVTTSDGAQHLASGEQAAGTEDDGVSDEPGPYQVLVRVQATSGADGSSCTITETTVVPS